VTIALKITHDHIAHDRLIIDHKDGRH
jgi:hypothetical protein